jgi:hypothetical protein
MPSLAKMSVTEITTDDIERWWIKSQGYNFKMANFLRMIDCLIGKSDIVTPLM